VIPSEAAPIPTADPTYRWHNHLTLESSSDTVVNTLGLSPAGVEAFVCVCIIEKLEYFNLGISIEKTFPTDA
jgi:hypothetical protein